MYEDNVIKLSAPAAFVADALAAPDDGLGARVAVLKAGLGEFLRISA